MHAVGQFVNQQPARVALVGNPNVGKTLVFNALTGSHQRVGNWPGVTVEQHNGVCHYQEHCWPVIDLPGVYSLAMPANTGPIDQQITAQVLHQQTPDFIINVVDASHFSRNLSLTCALRTLAIPMLIVLTKVDVAKREGVHVCPERLAQLLDCPVVVVDARQNQGVDQLKQLIAQRVGQAMPARFFGYPDWLNQQLTSMIASRQVADTQLPCASCLSLALEGDCYTQSRDCLPDRAHCSAIKQRCQQLYQEPIDIMLAAWRYQFIHQVLMPAVVTTSVVVQANLTQKIDRWALHRLWALPIFLVVLYLVFFIAMNLGGVCQDLVGQLSRALMQSGAVYLASHWALPAWMYAVLHSGLGQGVATVMAFLPILLALFFCLAFLEESGYMARAAFVMDRMMRILGLPGRAFLPMMIGFGCNVPAVLSSRSISGSSDRVLTVLMMPFMSCGARLAIYSLFAAAFFTSARHSVVALLYTMGVVFALLTGWLIKRLMLQGSAEPLLIEMPNYQYPGLRALWRLTWRRSRQFLWRASRVILPVCCAVCLLNRVDMHGHVLPSTSSTSSVLAVVGKQVTPLLEPMGVAPSNWPASVGLLTGVLAKEVVIGTLNSLYDMHSVDPVSQPKNLWRDFYHQLLTLPQALTNPIAATAAPEQLTPMAKAQIQQQFTANSAMAYLLFVMLYFPCVSTLIAIKREIGQRWAVFSLLWSLYLAYAVAVIFYQVATIVDHPRSTVEWVGGLLFVGWVLLLTYRQAVFRRVGDGEHVAS